MAIITAPHPSLRQKALEVTKIDKKILKIIKTLEADLRASQNPQGVGLAGPQIDKKYRIFATQFEKNINIYINPRIIKKSQNKNLGENKEDKEARLEGCLSIPHIYGPVYRHEWIELSYQVLDKNYNLINKKNKFKNFKARVIQHEYDHLDGILFTDYLLESDLPAYQLNQETKKLEELADKKILEIF